MHIRIHKESQGRRRQNGNDDVRKFQPNIMMDARGVHTLHLDTQAKQTS